MQWSLVIAAKSEPRSADWVRPRLGLKPKTPHTDAGWRIEPPPSFACASGTRPAATATALPPDEPAAEQLRSQGLCVTPSSKVSVLESRPSSEVALLPTQTRPDLTSSSPYGVCRSLIWRAKRREPIDQRRPGQGVESLTRNGTPANGPRAGVGRCSLTLTTARSS